MRKAFACVLAVMTAAFASAQDIITMTDGLSVEATVVEVSGTSVRYLRADSPEGPQYLVGLDDVARIEYRNGRTEEYGPVLGGSASDITSVVPGMDYGDYKKLYRASQYRRSSSDIYDPGVCAALSAVIPGLGQMAEGEVWRGALYMVGFAVTLGEGIFLLDCRDRDDVWCSFDNPGEVGTAFLGASLALYVCNICNASKIAKIKNMYLRDCRSAWPSVSVSPYVASVPQPGGGTAAAGMRLSLTF